jgi:hypothetical protein
MMNTTYQVIDIRTNEVVATRSTRKAARRLADKLDLEYGAIRYSVKEAA